MEDAPEEVMGVMVVEEGRPVQDECSPEYGLWVRGEQRWERSVGPVVAVEPFQVARVREVDEEQLEESGGARESLQARIDRELAGGQEEGPGVGVEVEDRVQAGEPERAEPVAEEMIEWLVRRLMENGGRNVEELREEARSEFRGRELPGHFNWIVAGIRKGFEKGKEEGRRRDRGRRRDVRVQTEMEDSGAQKWGVQVQTDMTGTDLEKVEKRAYEGIRASQKKSRVRKETDRERLKVTIATGGQEEEVEVVMEGGEEKQERTEVDRERLKVTIATGGQEEEVEVVMEGGEEMPELLTMDEFREIEEEFEEGELPVLVREVEREAREEESQVEVRMEEEKDGLGVLEEFELGWEEVEGKDSAMTEGVFGQLCEAVAMVEIGKWEEMEGMVDDLLTGWVLPEAGSPNGRSSPF